MMVVCAIDRPRSTIISTRSRRLSLKRRYQRTHRMHAQDNDVAVEVTTLEQLLDRLQLAHCRPRLVQHASVADQPCHLHQSPMLESRESYGAPRVHAELRA